jgi:glycosyltransferase involved in cell wall biosynthesis
MFVRKLRAVIRSERPDAIFVSFIWTMPAVWLARAPGRTPVYLDTQNVETERLQGAGSRWWRLAALFERAATHLATQVFVVSEEDRDLLVRLGTPPRKAVLLPNGYDDESFSPDPESGRAMRHMLGVADRELTVLYFGHMGYAPNQEALDVLRRDVLPIFDQKQIEYRLVVAGRHSSELAQQYDHPQIVFAGTIDRIQDAINAADVVAVPLLRGGGTRLKIIESVACGTPVVSTTAGAAGLDRSTFGAQLTIADDWTTFACALLKAGRLRASGVAPPNFKDRYGWAAITSRINFDE